MNVSVLSSLDLNSFLPAILLVLIQITLLAAVGLTAARCFSRDPASRHVILVVTFIVILEAPLLTCALQQSGWRLGSISWQTIPAPLPSPSQTSPLPRPVAQTIPHLPPIPDTEAPFEESSPAPVEEPKHSLTPITSTPVAPPGPAFPSFTLAHLWQVLIAVWFIGLLFLVARLSIGYWHVKHLVRTSQPLLLSDDLRHQLRSLFPTFLPTSVRVHDSLSTAIATGVLRPVVMLPALYVETLSQAELATVLTHELAHLTRRDPLIGFLQRIAAILYWPHPLVHLLNRQLSRAREELCDNFALQVTSTTNYAELLFRLSQSSPTNVRIPAGLTISFLDPRWKLEHRIAGILDHRRLLSTKYRGPLLGTAMILSLGLTFLLAGIRNADEPAQRTELASETADTSPATLPFQVTLADGTRIELLGVGEYPPNEAPWWRPDGTPLADKPKQPDPGLSWTDKNKMGRGFSFQILNLDPKSTLILPGHSSSMNGNDPQTGKVPDSYWITSERIYDKTDKSATITLEYSKAPWKTIHNWSADSGIGSMTNGKETLTYAPAGERNGNTIVTVTYSLPLHTAARIIAIDHEGHEHVKGSPSSITSIPNNLTLSATFLGLPFSKVKTFQFQTRPLQVIEFRNVSLQPNSNTQVEIFIDEKRYPTPADVLKQAHELAEKGRYAEALQKHLWYHENALKIDPALMGVRLSFALSDWKKLGEKYPPAKAAMIAIRDKDTKTLESGGGDFNLFLDVANLNRELDEPQKTSALFKTLDQQYPSLAKSSYHAAESDLITSREYNLCSKYLSKPLQSFERLTEQFKGLAANPASAPYRGAQETWFTDFTIRKVKILSGSNRKPEAEQIRDEALKTLDTPAFRKALDEALQTQPVSAAPPAKNSGITAQLGDLDPKPLDVSSLPEGVTLTTQDGITISAGPSSALPPGARLRLGGTTFKHPGEKDVYFSADGQTLISVGGSTFKFWNAKTGELLRTITSAKDYIQKTCITPDHKHLFALGFLQPHAARPRIHVITRWNLTTGQLEQRHELPTLEGGTYECLTLSPDGSTLATGDFRGVLQFFDSKTREKLSEQSLDGGGVHGIAIAPDGNTLAVSQSHANNLFLWNPKTEAKPFEIADGRRFDAVAFSPDGKLLAVGPNPRDDVQLYDVPTRKLIRSLAGAATFSVKKLLFASDSKTLIGVNRSARIDRDEGGIYVWDVTTGHLQHHLTRPGFSPTSLDISPQGDLIAACDTGAELGLWNLKTGDCISSQMSAGHTGPLRHLSFSPKSNLILTTSVDTSARVWDARTGKQLANFKHLNTVNTAAFSPDQTLVATSSGDTVSLWNLSTGKKLYDLHKGFENFRIGWGLSFSPDQQELRVVKHDLTLQVWGTSDGKLRRELPLKSPELDRAWEKLRTSRPYAGDHPLYVRSIFMTAHAITSDGSRFIAATNNFYWIFDSSTGKELIHFQLPIPDLLYHSNPLYMTVSQDGKRLAFTTFRQMKTETEPNPNTHPPEILVVETETGKVLWRKTRGRSGHFSLRFSPDGKQLAAGPEFLGSSSIDFFNAETGDPIRSIDSGNGNSSSNEGLAFSPDGKQFAAMQRDATILLWNTDKFQSLPNP